MCDLSYIAVTAILHLLSLRTTLPSAKADPHMEKTGYITCKKPSPTKKRVDVPSPSSMYEIVLVSL